MAFMFCNCSSLTSLDLHTFNTSKVTDMNNMFTICLNLTDLNTTGFDTSHVTDFSDMFSDLEHLTTLDLRHFNMSSANDYGSMFSITTGLTDVYLPAKFFPESCYDWDGNWNSTSDIYNEALSSKGGLMFSDFVQGGTCTFHCQNDKDVRMLNAIRQEGSFGYGTLTFENCSHQP